MSPRSRLNLNVDCPQLDVVSVVHFARSPQRSVGARPDCARAHGASGQERVCPSIFWSRSSRSAAALRCFTSLNESAPATWATASWQHRPCPRRVRDLEQGPQVQRSLGRGLHLHLHLHFPLSLLWSVLHPQGAPLQGLRGHGLDRSGLPARPIGALWTTEPTRP